MYHGTQRALALRRARPAKEQRKTNNTMKTNKPLLITAILPLIASLNAVAENDVTNNTKPAVQNAEPGSVSHSWRASEIIGTNVKNAQDDIVGEVKDLVLELASEEVIAVVISTGGFLGIGDNLSAVALSTLRYDSEDKVFRTSTPKEDLEKEPRFTSRTWPGYDKEKATATLRSVRDKVGGDVTQPDNTAQNERDLNGDTLTPLDQGKSESDLHMTRNIRSSIVGADLSFNAKNIKIITKDGHVTLRGVVQSQEEHEAVLRLARNHADASKITDQLKVNTK
jgi:hyperosmotically inducible periplasmic protein